MKNSVGISMQFWRKLLLEAHFTNNSMSYYLLLLFYNILELLLEVLIHFLLQQCGYL